jgi:ring-1,2-phenylacetyl-CoA epoxidase subunit PaaE
MSGPSPVAPARSPFHRLRVARVDRLCADASAITFDVPAELAGAFAFRAGQAITVRRVVAGRDERRTYSVASPPGAPARIGVREVPGGAISSWLVHTVRPGDEIEVQAPSGAFTPDTTRPGTHVFIAAGSGITPVLSILTAMLAEPGTRATLLYGNRRSDSVMFLDELADLKDAHPARFELFHVLSREPQEVEAFNGRLDRGRLGELLPALCDVGAVDGWWLCGPYGMVTDAHSVLTALGVQGAAIHRELFYVEDTAPDPPRRRDTPGAAPGSEVTVVLDGRATTTSVPWELAVLDGAQRVRPDLPFACKGGVCGTCRARLTHGEVRMRRNFALEQSELDAGFVLTCQALPVTRKVTIDYDA